MSTIRLQNNRCYGKIRDGPRLSTRSAAEHQPVFEVRVMSDANSIKTPRSVEEIRNAIDILKRKSVIIRESAFCDAFESRWRLDESIQALTWAIGIDDPDFEEELTTDDEHYKHSAQNDLNNICEQLTYFSDDMESIASSLPDSYLIHAAACGLSLVQQAIEKWFDDQAPKISAPSSPPIVRPSGSD